MSSSGTATGLGAVTPATPVSSRELHVAPIANARREVCYLVAAFLLSWSAESEPGGPTRFRGQVCFWSQKMVVIFSASRRWQQDLIF